MPCAVHDLTILTTDYPFFFAMEFCIELLSKRMNLPPKEGEIIYDHEIKQTHLVQFLQGCKLEQPIP